MRARKKPVEIEARRTGVDYDEDLSIMRWCGGRVVDSEDDRLLFVIDTLEGPLQVTPGDVIIRGVQGEHYPCKPDIFEATYDVIVGDEPAESSAQDRFEQALRDHAAEATGGGYLATYAVGVCVILPDTDDATWYELYAPSNDPAHVIDGMLSFMRRRFDARLRSAG